MAVNADPNPNHEGTQDAEGARDAGWQRLTTESLRRIEDLAQERVGQTLAGRFKLEGVLAIGGMATVYEAIQAPLNRRVAVKILHPTEIEAGRREYFLREANAAAGLRHPNIISIVDFGQEDDGTLFLAMEYVPGLTFSELLAQEYPLPPQRLIHIIEQVCLALEVAHRAGVVHCDMKPGNIMIESVPGNPDHVKVLDFGISRPIVKERDEADETTEEIIGSYYYMAPEQIMGRSVSPRTDVYGLGVVLYTALTAAFPFDEPDDVALMRSIVHQMPQHPSQVRPELAIPRALDAVVMQAMAKHPEDRFASCAEFRKALLALDLQGKLHSVALDPGGPHSLEMLIPEDELFEIDVEMHDGDIDPVELAEVMTELENEEIIPGLLASDEALPAVPPLPGKLPRLPEALTPMPATEPLKPGEVAVAHSLSGRPPIIGRTRQLEELRRAAMLTRRGAVAVQVVGDYGNGSSFFISRAVEDLSAETGATILMRELRSEAREYPFQALYDLVCRGLDKCWSAEQDGLSGEIPVAALERRLHTLEGLGLERIEVQTLSQLLNRWGRPDEEQTSRGPYDMGPLRFPETRVKVLGHAFAELLRTLLTRTRPSDGAERGQRAPLVMVIDGWEFCDGPSRQVLRTVLTERRNLPLMFVAVAHRHIEAEAEIFPEEINDLHLIPYVDGKTWDFVIDVPPYSLAEIRQYIGQQTGQLPTESFAQRVSQASGGSPLFIKELLHLHAATSAAAQEAGLPPTPLPDNPGRLFAHQIERLSRDGKMLLAVCTLLGPTFPEAAVHIIMPSEFDVGGTFAELMGARVLEPVGDQSQRLRFRFPKMRSSALRRLHPKLRDGLHQRIVKLLIDGRLPIRRNEAELWMAVHSLKANQPIEALDHLLDAAETALDRWEPELALRRCRQAQIWIAACLARQQTSSSQADVVVLGVPDLPPEADPLSIDQEVAEDAPLLDLEARGVRAIKLMLTAARRLQIAPERAPNAVISEKLPQRFLDQVSQKDRVESRLRAEAAFEIGRYFSRLELPQSARSAFQLARQLARPGADAFFEMTIDLEIARNLLRLGRHGQAADLTNHLVERIRPQSASLGTSPSRLSLSKPLDQLAKIFIGRRLYPRAEHFLDQARAIAEAERDHDQLCKIYLHYAALYRAQNLHKRTFQALLKANEVAQASHDLRSQARILYNLGITSAHLGQRAEGRRHLSEAIEVAINLGWTDFIALANGQIKKL